ncbi:MAG TPA: HDOD domain-containing protein [Actinoplanes sp.]|nr:HDOD domain-containing protein [Actinoplanes sp.]
MDSQEPATADRMTHVGRQPIYDRAGDVVAYELLFRDAAHATTATRRSAHATSQVMVAAFTEFGLTQLVGTQVCFINVTREFLTGELPIPFESSHAVLEVVETVEVDEEVVQGVKDLIERGFTIALDDFGPGPHEQLLPYATFVKIDMLDVDPAVVENSVRLCREHPHIQLVAERLETEEELARAMDLGFSFFQGHVLGRPRVMSTVKLSPSRLNRLQLLTALSTPEADIDEVTELIDHDPAVSYRILQATNAAASGISNRVSSVREASALLGLERVRQWVTLMLISDLTEATEEQMSVILTRARICQTTADRIGLPGPAAFTTGLLSGVAELVGYSAADIADQLPLAENIERALAHGDGELGGLLNVVRDYEQGDPSGLADLLTPEEAVRVYLNAVEWTHTLTSAHSTTG